MSNIWYCCGRGIKTPHCPNCGGVKKQNPPPPETSIEELKINLAKIIDEFDGKAMAAHNAAHTFKARAIYIRNLTVEQWKLCASSFGFADPVYEYREQAARFQEGRAAGHAKLELSLLHKTHVLTQALNCISNLSIPPDAPTSHQSPA